VIDLLNLLKDVDHVTHFTGDFSSVASRTNLDEANAPATAPVVPVRPGHECRD
jgi:hypothetical protein